MSRTLRLKIAIPDYCRDGGEIIDLVDAITAMLNGNYRFREIGTISERCTLEHNGRKLDCKWSVREDDET